MTLGLWLVVAVAAGIAAVVFARTIQRKRFASDRQPIPLDDLARQVSPPVSPEIFREVWTTVGIAYGIDPRMIKPDDELKRLAAIDSWDLGRGGDKLEDWLRTKNLGPKPRVETVKDLALWVQSGSQA